MTRKCRCGKRIVIFRKYEGRGLCRYHFIRSVEEKAKKTISKYYSVGRNETIAVGVSGGKDSTALLLLLHRIFGKRTDIRMFAISIDEGIPGYRDESLQIAKKLCKKLGIKHHIFSFKEEFGKPLHEKVKNIRKKKEGGPCTYCGVGRRYLLNRKSRELGATRLALGMNLDDEIQGILMNYMRGDLIRLSRMGGHVVKDSLFVPRIKPFREIPEKEVGLYAFLNSLEIQEDECPLLEGPRFKVRDFLNELESESPGTKFSIIKSYDRLLPSLRKGMKTGGYMVDKCTKCREPTSSQKVCKTCELWNINQI
ncbi:MAG: TIGR00269 family protein [Candidatus Aenigmarchaeota archaeon]|nr:TIGR00269 family protein [Candidatus Aenigmarchaeota archaeon]